MTNITIVTAFYDIGRGDWTPDKGLPHYLHRTTDTYIERFANMTQLENEIIVFSTPDIIAKLHPLNTKGNIKFVEFDFMGVSKQYRDAITSIQKTDAYQMMISPYQRTNPEYWNAEYVAVNFFKATFVNMAIEHGLVSNDLVAWLDFGYCRTPDKIPASRKWSYDFDSSKMHLFNYMDYDNKTINEIISNNIVYTLGAKIVGSKTTWFKFSELMFKQFMKLINAGMVDDDQTLMLMSYLDEPDFFELHRIPDHQKGLDPFVIFQDFNNEA
jgi:protein YibB